ncbi:hypothetical protein OEZ86_004282 [Tetradesmus obliquus]|nr:hypothetical protein OEZ86_004282 [Tetradesmus obliquus]
MMVLLSVWRLDPAAAQKFPLFVSVDGGDQRTLQFAAAWKEAAGVQLFFECHQAPFLTFVEEDLAVAPDFFSYMEAASALLQQDSSLWCISAWNDHGQIGRASNVTALYRTDVMPGLGWMTNKQQGLELAKNWPAYYWDDWMRKKEVRRGRHPRASYEGVVMVRCRGQRLFLKPA